TQRYHYDYYYHHHLTIIIMLLYSDGGGGLPRETYQQHQSIIIIHCHFSSIRSSSVQCTLCISTSYSPEFVLFFSFSTVAFSLLLFSSAFLPFTFSSSSLSFTLSHPFSQNIIIIYA